jgi:hypothetical protein
VRPTRAHEARDRHVAIPDVHRCLHGNHTARNVDHTVDIVLSLILVVGDVFGAQFGINAGAKLKPEMLRAALVLLIFAIAVRLFVDLVVKPSELYSTVVIPTEVF